VDTVKLFDQFNMKKELESREKVKLEMLGKQMDSIGNMLKMAQATKNEEDIKKLTYSYSYMKTSLEEEYKQGNHDINEQVWKRLNPALDEYGKKNGLHLIIGANGMGTVLYNEEAFDLTNDVIKYVNKKYEEGN
jgi:outer membrane protein